jgi:predicted RNase H-like HicB family nuclease
VLKMEVYMIKKVYEYYAIFSYDDDGITINFPDIPGCISCGFTTEEADFMAREALKLYIEGMEEIQIPKPSSKDQIEIERCNQKIRKIQITVGDS